MSGPSSSSDALTSRWTNAPNNVLENILQRVELPERLNVCALVCSSWRKAAIGASSSIALDNSLSAVCLESFRQWLERHGSSVSSITLVADNQQLPENLSQLGHVPCSNLRNLDLLNFYLQLAPAESEPELGLLSGATALTRLALGNCLLHDPEDGIDKLQALTGLQELKLSTVMAWTVDHRPEAISDSSEYEFEHAEMDAGPAADSAALPDDIVYVDSLSEFGIRLQPVQYSIRMVDLPGDVLAALGQLTKLVLREAAADPLNTLEHISCLTALQDLHLAQLRSDTPVAAEEDEAATLAGIGQLQQLTSLVLNDVPGIFSMPYLAGEGGPQNILPALQHLHVERVTFEPAILEGLTGLTHLQLTYVSWVVDAHDIIEPAHPAHLQLPTAGRGAYKLLLVLPALQQLRQLRLDITDWPQAAYQLPAYSALTSNSNLERLELHNSRCPLPVAAWKHIFRQGLQLPGIAGINLEFPAQAPRTFEGRLLSCCPSVQGAPERERFHRYESSFLELVCNAGMPRSVVRLLEVNEDDAAGVPTVLPALTTLSVGFGGRYHTFSVMSMPESCFAWLKR